MTSEHSTNHVLMQEPELNSQTLALFSGIQRRIDQYGLQLHSFYEAMQLHTDEPDEGKTWSVAALIERTFAERIWLRYGKWVAVDGLSSISSVYLWPDRRLKHQLLFSLEENKLSQVRSVQAYEIRLGSQLVPTAQQEFGFTALAPKDKRLSHGLKLLSKAVAKTSWGLQPVCYIPDPVRLHSLVQQAQNEGQQTAVWG